VSIQFSIPPPLAWIFARKRVRASLLGRLVEQQAPNEAARVIHALRLADSQVSLDELLNRSARAMGQPIGVVECLDDLPRRGTTHLHLIQESLAGGTVEIGYRRSDGKIASSSISRDGERSGRTLLEFGKPG